MMSLRWRLGASALSFLVLAGCSSADSDEGGYSDSKESDGAGNLSSGDGDGLAIGDFGMGGAGSLAPLPEEIEDEESYRAPVATGRYLWSANPESGRVALIDVLDLSVKVLSAGLFPTHMVSVPGADVEAQALVLNVGSSDATRFVVSEGEDGSSVKQSKVGTHVGANRWSVSESGKWAVAWTRPEPREILDPTEGLQEITVIDLSGDTMKATRLTVGYRPSQVQIAEDDETLIVVSEEGITLIDLTGTPEPDEWIDLGFEEETRDVSLSHDGAIALVRRTGHSSVELIELGENGKTSELSFSAPVTDVDLSASGRAVAVIREERQLATFTLEDVLSDPTDIDTVKVSGEVFGSAALTEEGDTVVLYTNALANDRVSIVNLDEQDDFLSFRSVSTQTSVFSVTTTPDGGHAAVLGGDGAGNTSDSFSLLALRSERFPRVVGTGAPVAQVALANGFGVVTATSKGGGLHEAYLLEMPSLSTKKVVLSTEPLSAGVIQLESDGVSLAYSAQRHPEGRVTFFDFVADQARTLTGFELSAEVVDE